MKCPMCSHTDFILTGGFFTHDLQQNLTTRQIGGVSVPVVPLVCKNCSFLLEYSAIALGVMKPQDSVNTNEEKK